MVFGATKASAERKPQMTSTASPTFSTLGRSPSIGPPAYTTDDLLAAKYQRFSRWVHLIRVTIAAVTVIASVAVIGCVGASLRAYSGSRREPEWILPLWPLDVDLRPSHAILGCGIAVAVLSLGYLAVASVPMVSIRLSSAIHSKYSTYILTPSTYSDEDSTTPTSSPPSFPSSASASRSSPSSSPQSSRTICSTARTRGPSFHGRAGGTASMTWRRQTSRRFATTAWRRWIWSSCL